MSRRAEFAVALALGGWMIAAPPAGACRCPQASLDDYFERAEIVLIAEVAAVTSGERDGGGYRAVRVEPISGWERPFKGGLEGLDLRTPIGSASCGVDVEVGRSYVIFASVEPVSGIAWFDTCSGSRRFSDGGDPSMEFLDLPDSRVVPRLAELARLHDASSSRKVDSK